MTAPFPTRRQEEWRYADLDALQPVWEQFARPLTLTVGAGESLEEVWLPTADDVQLRRVQIALGQGARARIFALNTAPVYGRIELELSLAEAADFELFAANIGSGLSTNEIVTTVKHIGVAGRDTNRRDIAELLPDGLQGLQVGVTPFLLFAGWEGRGHARLRRRKIWRSFWSRRRCRSGAISPYSASMANPPASKAATVQAVSPV